MLEINSEILIKNCSISKLILGRFYISFEVFLISSCFRDPFKDLFIPKKVEAKISFLQIQRKYSNTEIEKKSRTI